MNERIYSFFEPFGAQVNRPLVMAEMQNTQNAATLGLGFHKFDGNVAVKDVMHQIGADFTVREDRIVRVTDDMLAKIRNGEPVVIPAGHIIDSHKATVCDEADKTIGIVGEGYGTIQNNSCFEILDLMCSASVTDTPLKIVSAGMVHDFEPYLQAELPDSGLRINGDPSETKFYAFVHTAHDGSSGLQVRFSPVRVVCQNTFMANVSSRCGFTFKHTRHVHQRIDLTEEANIQRIRERVAQLNLFTKEYVDNMNFLATQPVTQQDINEFALNMFIDEEKVKEAVRAANYRFRDTEGVSTRAANTVESFLDTLHSSRGGQDFASGSKLWLFNATTNFTSNVASYGNARKDSEYTIAEKRFDSMMNGIAGKRVERALELLSA